MAIEKGIPLPGQQALLARNELLQMEIGDSVFHKWGKEPNAKINLRVKLYNRARYAAPRKFKVRLWPVENPTGFRQWRVE